MSDIIHSSSEDQESEAPQSATVRGCGPNDDTPRATSKRAIYIAMSIVLLAGALAIPLLTNHPRPADRIPFELLHIAEKEIDGYFSPPASATALSAVAAVLRADPTNAKALLVKGNLLEPNHPSDAAICYFAAIPEQESVAMLRQHLKELIGKQLFTEAREASERAAKDMPAESEVQAFAALLAWGGDRFDHASWERSVQYAKIAYPDDPIQIRNTQANGAHPIGRIIRIHTERQEPLAIPTYKNVGNERITQISAHNLAYPIGGSIILQPGQIARYGHDGKLASVNNSDGSIVWRVANTENTGEVLVDSNGIPHIMLGSGNGDAKMYTLDEIRNERWKLVGWQ